MFDFFFIKYILAVGSPTSHIRFITDIKYFLVIDGDSYQWLIFFQEVIYDYIQIF